MGKKFSGQDSFLSFLEERSQEIIGRDDLRNALATGKKLRVKLGVDPTSPRLHLGHVVPLRILRAFQDAGHKAVVIIGDFTAGIGDPSGRAQARKQLSPREVRANERVYRREIGRVVRLEKTEFRHNSEWLAKVKLGDFLGLLMNFSLKSSWEREDFQRRLAEGKEVRLHEAMYHVLQAYDSVVVGADVELGSLDQKLNILAGRELQKKMGQKPQSVVLLPYLLGLSGGQKMSKSAGNTINLGDSAKDMVGKVMSIPDALIINYAELAAWFPPAKVEEIKKHLAKGGNPRDVKMDIAEAVSALYHGGGAGSKARAEFLAVFSKKQLPKKMLEVKLAQGWHDALRIIGELGAVSSKSEARRLARGRALEVDGKKVGPGEKVEVRPGSIVRLGKKKFYRII